MVAWGGGSRGWAAILTTSAILGCDLVDKLLEGQERAARDDAVLERRAHHRVISGAGNRLGHDEREVGHTCLARGGRQVCGRAHVHLEQLRRVLPLRGLGRLGRRRRRRLDHRRRRLSSRLAFALRRRRLAGRRRRALRRVRSWRGGSGIALGRGCCGLAALPLGGGRRTGLALLWLHLHRCRRRRRRRRRRLLLVGITGELPAEHEPRITELHL